MNTVLLAPPPLIEEPDTGAAAIAFAMLRFAQGAAHKGFGESPKGHGGKDWYVFLPSWRRMPHEDVLPYLASLPCPAMLMSTTTRGSVSLLLLDELQGERRRWGQKNFDNQSGGLIHAAGELGLTPESRVVLEFDDEEHLFTFAVLQRWAERFCVDAGWNLRPCGDDRAAARLWLIRADHEQSWGGSCPLRPKQDS
jgi:hypothetical protein